VTNPATTLPPIPADFHQDLERFIGTARWFGGKGRPFRVTGVRRAGELGGDGPAQAVVELVSVTFDDSVGGVELYQVPLSLRREPEDRLEHAFVGRWDDLHVYDAVHDREAMGLWLDAFGSAPTVGTAADAAIDAAADAVVGHGLLFHRSADEDLDLTAQAAMISAEQSNSSVVFGEQALMKVFRKVTQGVNPDIQVHDVLTRAGCDHVAALYGWLDVSGKAPDGAGDTSDGSVIQLAMLQQFLRTASDGWQLARASVRNLFAEADLHADEVGGDFAGESARLGTALAETHAVLAEQFPTAHLGRAALQQIAAGMTARLDAAVAVLPDLAAYAEQLRPIFTAVAALDDLPVQRIHGDLHLGQTLRTVKGWKLVDFEGEPARPLADRLLPESVWRDVAGMLRSFDYAAQVVHREFDSDPRAESDVVEQRLHRADEWSERNRRAFVAAYAGRDLTADELVLLAAFEADKAVYECVYEARNRPGWAMIPLSAVARLADGAPPAVAE
jgi:maltokinase